jgi:hypothetical protein
MEKPYRCPVCGHRFSTPYGRCIGVDGKHRPTFPILSRRYP